MTDGAVTMSRQMNEEKSPVGGDSTADPLVSPSEENESQPRVQDLREVDPGASEPDVEIVDGLPVLAEVRTVDRAAPAALPAVQVAAVAATGFVAGAATVALVKRRAARKMVRSSRGGSRRAVDLLPIAASRSFLVDVHVISKPE
jgi:hypothetical protein